MKKNDSIPDLVNAIGGTTCGLALMLLTLALGAGSTSLDFFLIGVSLWAIFYLATGLKLVGENEFIVIERFKQYRKTGREGWHLLCLPGIVDRISPFSGSGNGKSDFKEHEVKLAATDPTNEIDFTDGVTAPIKVQFWYRVIKGNPPYTYADETEDPVWRWTYRIEKSEEKASEIVLGAMRELLQGVESDKAQSNMKDFGPKVIEEVKTALEALGAEIVPDKGVILTDIVLPEDIQKVKQEVLVSEKKAAAMKNLSRGLSASISEIIKQAQVNGKTLTWDEAAALSLQYRTLEVLEKKEGNINFVAQDVGAVVKTMDINNGNQP